mmetsp:Transcript_118052/g.252181  ORF Transcript_118052/g.252181 Transcript_118052/m.252181 type:complete len:247 (-) Transcript_118052:2181-2921(-)
MYGVRNAGKKMCLRKALKRLGSESRSQSAESLDVASSAICTSNRRNSVKTISVSAYSKSETDSSPGRKPAGLRLQRSAARQWGERTSATKRNTLRGLTLKLHLQNSSGKSSGKDSIPNFSRSASAFFCLIGLRMLKERLTSSASNALWRMEVFGMKPIPPPENIPDGFGLSSKVSSSCSVLPPEAFSPSEFDSSSSSDSQSALMKSSAKGSSLGNAFDAIGLRRPMRSKSFKTSFTRMVMSRRAFT